jgi:hypothetical protein
MDAIELRRDVAFAESGFALPASGCARKIVAIFPGCYGGAWVEKER